MKKMKLMMAMAIGLGCWSNSQAEVIQPLWLEQSECKEDVPNARSEKYTDPLRATLSYENGVLTLSVYDYQNHCCPDLRIVANTDTEGEIHFFITDVSYWICDCICRRDLECAYEGILEGHYKVYLDEERYIGPLLEKEIDIEEGCSVTLDKPAGVDSVSSAADSPLSMGRDHVLTVNMQGQTELEIFDSEGRLVSVMTLQAPAEVSLATLPAGLYLLRATTADNSVTLRTIK